MPSLPCHAILVHFEQIKLFFFFFEQIKLQQGQSSR